MIGLALIAAALGGLVGYQVGAWIGWVAGWKRRAALSDQFEPTLLAMERHVGWFRGRLGWASPDRETDGQDKPRVWS